MKIAAGFVGILLGLYSFIYIGLVGGILGSAAGWVASFGAVNSSASTWAQTVQLLSWASPISCLIGGIVTFAHPRVGGAILLASAYAHYQLLGFGAVGNVFVFGIGATAILALIAGFTQPAHTIVLVSPAAAATAEPARSSGPTFAEQVAEESAKILMAWRSQWSALSSTQRRNVLAITISAVFVLTAVLFWSERSLVRTLVYGIEGFDFRNAAIDVSGTDCASADLASAGLSSVHLVDGAYRIRTPFPYSFSIVGPVRYGNIEGDLGSNDSDRAAFVARCSHGTSDAQVLFIYGLLRHAPIRFGAVTLAQSGLGEVRDLSIVDGAIRIEQAEGDAPCCATGVRSSTFTWFDNGLRLGNTTETVSVPDVPLPQKPEAASLVQSAIASIQGGDCSGAETTLSQAIGLDALNPAANYYYANCLVNGGDVATALMPLRIAAQYGAASVEGQLARSLAKELADRTSPSQGIDDGCAIPLMPPALAQDAPLADVSAAKQRAIIFFRASRRFSQCVADTLAQIRAQYGSVPDRLFAKLNGWVLRNERQEQLVNDQIVAAEHKPATAQ